LPGSYAAVGISNDPTLTAPHRQDRRRHAEGDGGLVALPPKGDVSPPVAAAAKLPGAHPRLVTLRCWSGVPLLTKRITPSNAPRWSSANSARSSWRRHPPSGPGDAAMDELVAGDGRLDQPSDQPAAAKRERWEHVPAAMAAQLGLGRGPVVRLLLRETPDPFAIRTLRDEATTAAGGKHACTRMPRRAVRGHPCRASAERPKLLFVPLRLRGRAARCGLKSGRQRGQHRSQRVEGYVLRTSNLTECP
jgi:hypothetical protein